MVIDEIRADISNSTGIPESLLTGETSEELISQAKAVLAYKRKAAKNAPKTIREEFKQWADELEGKEPEQGAEYAALDEIEKRAQGYPNINDAGELQLKENAGTPRDQFASFAADAMAFNPFKGEL